MRTVFLILLLANVAYFAYAEYRNVLFPGESLLLQEQVDPQAIKIVAPPKIVAPTKIVSPPNVVNATPAESDLACVEWGAFAPEQVSAAEAALAPLNLASAPTQHRDEDAAAWWVFMPPQGSRTAARRKAAELKQLGVKDYFIVQDDPTNRFAISLGVYGTRAAAEHRLTQLRAQGVHTARVGRHDVQDRKIWLQMRDIPAAVAAKLDQVTKAFPGTETRECAAHGAAG